MPSRRLFLTSAAVLASGVIGFFAGRPGDSPTTTPDSPSLTHSSNEARPLIGIASLDDPNYIRAVRDHGGLPVVLPNTDGSIDRINDYLEVLDGLLMPGGLDIPPSEYGEEPHPTVSVLSDERYRFEKHLIAKWIQESDKPLLGICLGSQWMNVASGGTLIQDIPSEKGGNHRGILHPITIDPDSRLGRIFESPGFEVNSNHHQAVDTLGQGLRIVATSPDGIVEATESTDEHRFLVGVQWHPERLIETDPNQAQLFEAFIEAAKQHANSK
jgi:putative glutamine amidotransferase